MTDLTLSVVICAHNEEEWLPKTLASLLEQARSADEIIVVDNASTDATANVIDGFAQKHPQANIKRVYQSRKGLHHAREAGWRAASSDIIVMTDADIMFPADWLRIVEDTFQDEGIDAITGIVRYHDANALINGVTWLCDQLYQPEGIGKLMTDQYVLNGGNSAYRRRVLEAVDGYLGIPADALEDRYMSQQIHDAGYTIRFVRNLKVWHTFRRFNKDGWRGTIKYIFFYTAENVYPDHLAEDER